MQIASRRHTRPLPITMPEFCFHKANLPMLDLLRSPALPDYMHERFVIAIWTRAFLLDDTTTLLKVTSELAALHPEFAPSLARITNAKTPAARDNAVLYFVLKNPILSPYI